MTADRPDLGVLLHRLLTTVIERELPILREHGVEMWEYAVLSALQQGEAPSQAVLAQQVGRDQTRLIPLLDGLEQRGLLRRQPDPEDRRHRQIGLTKDGRAVLRRCRRGIRAMEADLLSGLSRADRDGLLHALGRLVAQHPHRGRGMRRTLG